MNDLVVIGAGIHGLWAAVDAARRGLSVVLLEKDDFGAATSANSLKIVHGGLRYLQQGDVRRMRESIRERSILLRVAPRLVRPLPCLFPTGGPLRHSRLALRAALAASDLVGWDRNRGVPAENRLPRGRLVSRDECLRLAPGLDPSRLTGGALWHDAQVLDTERLAASLLRAALEADVDARNHCASEGVIVEHGRATGVRTPEGAILARAVLDAAGPWAERPLAWRTAMNLVVRTPPGSCAVGARGPDGRVLFFVPWRETTMIGTAYLPHDGAPSAADVEAFLKDAHAAMPAARHSEVALVHSGRLPLARPGGPLRRRPVLEYDARGVLALVGVKYTTARLWAERAVDLVCASLGHRASCRTAQAPLPDPDLGSLDLASRVRIAVREERARTLADVLRRLGLGSDGPPPEPRLQEAALAAAAELGWDRPRVAREAAAVRARYHPPS